MTPEYWPRAKRALVRGDATMGRIIRAYPKIALARRGQPFFTLARSIVGQQISVKAAQSVWNRLEAALPEVSPEAVLALERTALRACGLSERKVEYIADLARHFADGTARVERWPQMDDEDVIAELVQVRGIGRWTAEMFLIFNLLRPDVFPLDDLGLRKAMRLHYFRGRAVPVARMRKLGANWAPWRSVATWYLWRSLDPVPVEY
ncbi:MAG: DNA-3-methyladenine glycosylase 2 family protein [Betaproteobacteria bacterium]|nr:DNA-3-methyladenine glycosylase 2 family protein [Betaproteobacteria bacterium]